MTHEEYEEKRRIAAAIKRVHALKEFKLQRALRRLPEADELLSHARSEAAGSHNQDQALDHILEFLEKRGHEFGIIMKRRTESHQAFIAEQLTELVAEAEANDNHVCETCNDPWRQYWATDDLCQDCYESLGDRDYDMER